MTKTFRQKLIESARNRTPEEIEESLELGFAAWRKAMGSDEQRTERASMNESNHRRQLQEEPERVVCAAIYVDDGKAEPRRMSYAYPKTGLVFAGWRHGDCFVTLNAWANRLTDEEREEIGVEQLNGRHQGFITSKGRFVDRAEAARIALEQGQIPHPVSGLTSEDLY